MDTSHLDETGKARMVDVSEKQPTLRQARAEGFVHLSEKHLQAMEKHPKGDVLTLAQIAGIQAAKRTAEWIPLCHTISLDHIEIRFERENNGIRIESEARANAKTGVEMEALIAVSAAALTIYDMLKNVGHGIEIEKIRLLEKKGGKSDWKA
ncbi:MAG TPA: cyclic pyranopterin monophosphate synthase MoaC [Fimbriimonadales bacterium]|nr:cyclic pyranopterin monophosphate synthase MoaC [Fimbriimonadales bacterium]